MFIFQIGEGDLSTGNMTGAHDLQLALASQPLSQATGTHCTFCNSVKGMFVSNN